ncbi:MAG: hypothetical protein PHY93_03125 [Bacteriovorax sp.]|nr:hypothetical protein [Bacteriovorax sp.]
MIHGLSHFQNQFTKFSDYFVLVGGVATYLQLEDAGAPRVRATKDLDIVLMLKPSNDFLDELKKYILEGGYEIQKNDKGSPSFYRFQKPKNEEFPLIIELFATAPNEFKLFDDQHIVPITNPEEVESLSAILLDDEYFSLITSHLVASGGINLINEGALIPFKAKAYLEIKAREEDSRHWKKHRGDIINLAVTFFTENSNVKLSGKVKAHFEEFMIQLKAEINDEVVKGACSQKIDSNTVIFLLEKTFL